MSFSVITNVAALGGNAKDFQKLIPLPGIIHFVNRVDFEINNNYAPFTGMDELAIKNPNLIFAVSVWSENGNTKRWLQKGLIKIEILRSSEDDEEMDGNYPVGYVSRNSYPSHEQWTQRLHHFDAIKKFEHISV